MRKLRLFGPIGLLMWLLLTLACSPVSEPVTLGSEFRVMGQVDAQGGTVCSQQGVCLDIPAGAVETLTTIKGRIAETTSTDPDMVGAVYEFQADKETFKTSISLVLPLPSDVAKDQLADLDVVFFKDDAWVAVSSQTNHDSTKMIGSTDHLSRWGLRWRKCRPRPEVCDGKDNDCDGKIDEGSLCRTGQVCKLGSCVPKCSCQSDADCGAGSVCANCQCQSLCASGQTACNGQCTDLMSDASNCGGCGNRCSPAEICSQGACSTGGTCTRGQIQCGNKCVDVSTDSNNCGACGKTCRAGQSCAQGMCFGCVSGKIVCAGTCVDPNFDVRHCGACGKPCRNGEICSHGNCIFNPCSGGKTACGAACVDLTTDANNCGACGKVCPQGSACVQGACQGNSQCNGVQCPPGQTCVNGQCQSSCTPTKEVCDGQDNDCDGQIDEDYPGKGQPCQVPGVKGECMIGVFGCRQGLSVCTQTVFPKAEVCGDGKDNDCDGAIDDNCPCPAGATRACYAGPTQTRNKGTCKDGIQTCNGQGWGPCVGQVLPVNEVCRDGLDNDCDGQIDNSPACICTPGATQACYTGPSSTRNKGTCKDGIQTCSTRQQWGACVGEVLPAKETCDNRDNDCDGSVDEGVTCTCQDGQVRACGTDIGECKKGSQVCSGGQWSACVGQVGPLKEVCDGKDNDCDGQIDEDASLCPSGQLCVQGSCQPQCGAGQSSCQGACVDLSSDPRNCGACGQVCTASQTCSQGACVACSPAQAMCSGQCTNLNTDPRNCGACGKSCASGQICQQGACVVSCPAGQTSCSGQCVDLNSNMNNCGTCGNRCIQNTFCTQGVCQ